MNEITKYHFYKTKYGDELLIDVVMLKDIKKFLAHNRLHALTYYDITLITEGCGTFSIEDQSYHVSQGDILFTSPTEPREWDTRNIIDGYALIFEEEFLLSFFNDPDFLRNISYFSDIRPATHRLTLSKGKYEQVLSLIGNIRNEIQAYTKKDKHILRALLYQTLKYLERVFTEQNNISGSTKANQVTHRFIDLVNKKYNQSHAVRFYADELCITPNYLNEIIKKETGFPAKELINNKLLTEAKKHLRYSRRLSVAEIAETLNFENASYFIRFFRKHSGYTPLAYRNKEKP